MVDLHYTDVDRKAGSSSRSPGRLLFADRTAVIEFSSGVSKSLSSLEMRLLLRDRGREDPSLFFFAVMGVRAASQWGQVSDPRGLYPAVRRPRCLTVNLKELHNC